MHLTGKTMKIDGRCHCGEITFEAEVDPDALHICHCTDCQTLSGSAFRMNIPESAEHCVLRSTRRLISRLPKAATKPSTPSAALAAPRSMPARWKIRGFTACASVRSSSAPPSPPSGRSGDCLGWMRSPPSRRSRRAKQLTSRNRGTTMEEPQIRVATAADVPAIEEIVNQAYRHYVARIGKPPGPMLEDYAARVSEGAAWVLDDRAATVAIIVLKPEPDYLLLDNIAVSPARHGLGLGRRLLAFAEDEALRRGYREIRLYTHQTMVENQRLYTSIGYEETGRGTEAGYDRVFMRKQLID